MMKKALFIMLAVSILSMAAWAGEVYASEATGQERQALERLIESPQIHEWVVKEFGSVEAFWKKVDEAPAEKLAYVVQQIEDLDRSGGRRPLHGPVMFVGPRDAWIAAIFAFMLLIFLI